MKIGGVHICLGYLLAVAAVVNPSLQVRGNPPSTPRLSLEHRYKRKETIAVDYAATISIFLPLTDFHSMSADPIIEKAAMARET